MIARAIGWPLGALLAGLGWVDETLIPALRAIGRDVWDRLAEHWPLALILLLPIAVMMIESAD